MNIELTNIDGTGKTVVQSFLPFGMYGYTFAAHKFGPGMWGVSERSTGARVCTAETRKAAIRNAQQILIRVGAPEFERVIDRTKLMIKNLQPVEGGNR